MLTENEVVTYTAKYLKADGYHLSKVSSTNDRGYDIVAEKDGVTLYVEAKGQTSADKSSNRYGLEFDSGQKMDHVSKALYYLMKTLNKEPSSKVAIALPLDTRHLDLINDVISSIHQLKIRIFFVSEDGTVKVIN
jgi:hypothetical protein